MASLQPRKRGLPRVGASDLFPVSVMERVERMRQVDSLALCMGEHASQLSWESRSIRQGKPISLILAPFPEYPGPRQLENVLHKTLTGSNWGG